MAAETPENEAFETTWKARTRGLWGISALGLVLGAAIGAVAPFFPVIAGAQTAGAAVGLIGPSALVLGSVGMASGFAIGTQVGSGAGSAVVVEKSLKQLSASQEQEAGATPASGLWANLYDYVKPRVALFFAAVGAIGGAVMAGAYFALNGSGGALSGMSTVLGEAASNPVAVTSYFVGATASFGALFGTCVPKMATYSQDMAGYFLSGEAFGENTSPTQAQELAPTLESAITRAPAAYTHVSFQERVVQSRPEGVNRQV